MAANKESEMTFARFVMEEDDNPDNDSPIYNDEIGKNHYSLSLDQTSLLDGIILSEILGKPKSRRTGR
jgi:hypothetical protein